MVKSAFRALEIIDLLTAREGPMAFAEIGEALGIPKSSLHALLTTMAESGWLRQDGRERSFTLGIRALEAGNAYTRSLGLAERAAPVAEALRDSLRETVQIAVLDGRHNVYIAKYDGGQSLALISEVGRRLPAHATGLGKMLLADLSPAELDAALGAGELERFTPSTITDRGQLAAHLAETRLRGYSIDLEERTEGLHCIAVPIRDHTRRTVAAISVSAPAFRFGPERKQQALAGLQDASRRISADLGYRGVEQ